MLTGVVSRVCKMLAILALWSAVGSPQNSSSPLTEADKQFHQQSFAAALEGYQSALKTAKVLPARKDEIGLRVVYCLGECKKWDLALDAGLAFVKSHRGTVWEPRALSLLGRLYMQVPHKGYQVNGKTVRERNDDENRQITTGEEVALYAQDVQNSRDALEAACVLYPKFRVQSRTESDEIQNAYDLTRLLREFFVENWASRRDWAPHFSPTWLVDPSKPFNTHWPAPKKVEFLYRLIERLAGNGKHQHALALFARAAWLRDYHETMSKFAWSEDWRKPIWRPYPYVNELPEKILSRLIAQYPKDEVRPQSQMVLATVHMQKGRMAAAEKQIKDLLSGPIEGDKRSQAEQFVVRINAPELEFHTFGLTTPGKPAKLEMRSRNVKSVRFEAFLFDLNRAVDRAEAELPHDSYEKRGLGFVSAARFLKLAGFEDSLGSPIATWEESTADPGDHLYRSKTLTLPFSRPGAYLVRATAPGLRVSNVAIVSNLVLTQTDQPQRKLFYVADGVTGRPIAGAKVLMNQSWHNSGNSYSHSLSHTVTDGNGMAELPIRDASISEDLTIQVMATDSKRYAVNDEGRYWSHRYGENSAGVRTYGMMDRTAYRSGQKVNFRVFVTHPENAKWKPLFEREVTIKFEDNDDQVLHRATLRTNAFGTVNGSFVLPHDVKLGRYYLNAAVEGVRQEQHKSNGCWFRVEEYKKPEFRVSVTSGKSTRIGSRVTARISAKYYFGSPVAGARVNYRVYRIPAYYTSRFRRDVNDWVYGGSPRFAYGSVGGRDAMVTQGSARTDATGEARISFVAQAPKADPRQQLGDGDFNYVVDADVQDASRRTVIGSGSVYAARNDFRIDTHYSFGYSRPGETVEIELATFDSAGKAYAVSGEVKIGRAKGYYDTDVKNPVAMLRWRTDESGRGALRWKPSIAGQLAAVFRSRDSHGKEVLGKQRFFVAGRTELAEGLEPKVAGLYIRENKAQEGTVVKALLVAPDEGCTVLLSRYGGDELFDREIMTIQGRAMELDIPLKERDVPEFAVTALIIRDGEVRWWTENVLVKAVTRVAKVTVRPDRSEYEPGQRARISLHAEDWRGRPLRTELSVSISDASINYIDLYPREDIREFMIGTHRHTYSWSGSGYGSHLPSFPSLQDIIGESVYADWKTPRGMGRLKLGEDDYYSGTGMYIHFVAPEAKALESGELLRPRNHGLMGGQGGAAAPADIVNEQREGRGEKRDRGTRSGESDSLAVATLRKRFEDTAFWIPAVVTNANGDAEVGFTWPDNLTEWDFAGIGVTADGLVGAAYSQIVTRKELLVRPQAPRFLVARDEVTVSANIHNYLSRAARVLARIELDGDSALIAAGRRHVAEMWLDLPAGGERRADWPLKIVRGGTLRARMSARSAGAADAAEIVIPILPHGIERFVTKSGVLRGNESRAVIEIRLPAARAPGSGQVKVQLNPTLAAVMLDALPFLADYPYGCIEQTTSRFVPCVVVAKTLRDLGIDLDELRRRAKPPQVNDPRTGMPLPWLVNPVFDKGRLDDIVTSGLRRIKDWQRADGGWGWWQSDESDPMMSAYAVYGMLVARNAGISLPEGVLDRGLAYLKTALVKASDPHMITEIAWVLSFDVPSRGGVKPVADRLFPQRDKLSLKGKALLAVTLHRTGESDKSRIVIRNIENTAQVDDAEGTVHWSPADERRWRWYSSAIEMNVAVLEAYLEIDSNSRLVPMLAKWIADNRRESAWSSTRETALAVLAMARYVHDRKELSTDSTVSVLLGGRAKRTLRFDRTAALLGRTTITIPEANLRSARETLTVTRTGQGTIYWSVTTSYYSFEEPLRAFANNLDVTRRYYRLIPNSANVETMPIIMDESRPNPFLTGRYELFEVAAWGKSLDRDSGITYVRVPIREGTELESGDVIEAEIELNAHNDHNYVLVEDPKPSGCEPVEIMSGDREGQGAWSHMELRDQKVAFFVARFPQGRRAFTYRLRAETPGKFHILPAHGSAMYNPEIRGSSNEWTIGVADSLR